MKKTIRNCGFTLRLSKIKYRIKNPMLKYSLAGLLYIAYLLKKIYMMITGGFELDYVEVFITSRCNLRCRDCSILVPYLPKLEDFNVDEAINDLNELLELVDCIHKVEILGGEAMLNKDFIKILEFLAGNEKIRSIRVVTNGTFIPDKNIVDALQSTTKVHVNISEYILPNPGKRDELLATLKEKNIAFTVYENMTWYDLGGPDSPKIHNEKLINRRFRYCWIKRCNGILNGRFYLCARSIFLPMVRVVENDETDYFDLRNIVNVKNGRTELKKLLKKKSVTACAYCNGTFDSPMVPAAVQIDKNPMNKLHEHKIPEYYSIIQLD